MPVKAGKVCRMEELQAVAVTNLYRRGMSDQRHHCHQRGGLHPHFLAAASASARVQPENVIRSRSPLRHVRSKT